MFCAGLGVGTVYPFMLASIYGVYSSCTFHLKQRILGEDALAFVAFLRCGGLQLFTEYGRVCVRMDLMFALLQQTLGMLPRVFKFGKASTSHIHWII